MCTFFSRSIWVRLCPVSIQHARSADWPHLFCHWWNIWCYFSTVSLKLCKRLQRVWFIFSSTQLWIMVLHYYHTCCNTRMYCVLYDSMVVQKEEERGSWICQRESNSGILLWKYYWTTIMVHYYFQFLLVYLNSSFFCFCWRAYDCYRAVYIYISVSGTQCEFATFATLPLQVTWDNSWYRAPIMIIYRLVLF